MVLNIEGVNWYKVRDTWKGTIWHKINIIDWLILTVMKKYSYLGKKNKHPWNFTETIAALHSGCERKLSDFSDPAAAATWAYRYVGLGSRWVFKGISDFPHGHFCLSPIYLTVAPHATEFIPFILRVNYTE